MQRSLYDRPIGVFALMSLILVFGGLTLPRLGLDLFPPGFVFPAVFISLHYASDSVADTLEELTRPAEGLLRAQPGIGTIYSSTRDGRAFLIANPADGLEIEQAVAQIGAVFDANRHRFPADMGRPRIATWSPDDTPTAAFALAAGEDLGATGLERLVELAVVPALRRLPGVAEARFGREDLPDRALVTFDPVRARAAHIAPGPVASTIDQREQTTFALSHAGSDGRRRASVIHLLPAAGDEALERLRVGAAVRLGDVAAIQHSVASQERRFLVNGRPGITVTVYKTPQANGYRVSRAAQARIAALATEHGLSLTVVRTTHGLLDEALAEIGTSAVWGAASAVLFLLLFLRHLGLTALVCTAIPLSLAMAVVGMAIAGESINLLAAIGFLLALGMLVDNSVVVGEAMGRVGDLGHPAAQRRAERRAVRSVTLAIVISTLTTVVILLPFALVDPDSFNAHMILALGLPVVWCLLASLLVALVVVPILFPLVRGRPRRGTSGWTRWLERCYGAFILAILGRPLLTLAVGLALLSPVLLVLTGVVSVAGDGGIEHDDRRLGLRVQIRGQPELQAVEATMRDWQARLLAAGEDLGIRATSAEFTDHWGWMNVYLDAVDRHDRTRKEVEQAISELLEPSRQVLLRDHIDAARNQARERQKAAREQAKKQRQMAADPGPASPSATASASAATATASAATATATAATTDRRNRSRTKDQAPRRQRPPRAWIGITVNHPSAAALQPAWAAIRRHLLTLDGVVQVNEGDERQEEWAYHLTDLARRFGLRAGTVASQIRRYTSRRAGATLADGTVVEIGRDRGDRLHLAELEALPVWPGGQAAPIRLADITRRTTVEGDREIQRRDGMAEFETWITVEAGREHEIQNRILSPTFLDQIDAPPGTRLSLHWWTERQRREQGNMYLSLVLAAAIVYLLMGVFFESIIAPLAAMASVPLAAVSVVAWLAVVGVELDFMVLLGLFFLVGIVVNNGIVLVDRLRTNVPPERCANRRLVRAALAAAARRRLTPILLTTCTTAAAAVPMAVGSARIAGMTTANLGTTIAVGLLGSMVCTLFVVPVAFYWLGRCRHGWTTLLSGQAGTKPTP